jgi:hypothetical protein
MTPRVAAFAVRDAQLAAGTSAHRREEMWVTGKRTITWAGTTRLLPLYPQQRTKSVVPWRMALCAMYGRRPRCKRNLTFPRMVGCGHVFGLLLQPLWPLAMM